LIKVGSFVVPEKMFVNDEKLKFGFQNAIGSSSIEAKLKQDQISMTWSSVLKQPKFIVESKTKLAQEILTNIMNGISAISVDGSVSGTFKNLDMKISSNLGDELGNGFNREIGNKIADAQNQIQKMVDEKIMKPKNDLMAAIGGNKANLSSLSNIGELYKKNEDQIKKEIEKLKKGGTNDLKEQGKKLLKGFKF
jgi:(p)ppGpp synthase/HD superfamily hydrolase